jgi:hypothetical protein
MLLTTLAHKHDFQFGTQRSSVFWLRVRLIAKVEFAVLSISFELMIMKGNM